MNGFPPDEDIWSDTDTDCEPDFRSGWWLGFIIGNLNMMFFAAVAAGIVTAVD